jgi:hypothetical protein
MREQSLAHMTERFRLIEQNSAISEREKTEKIQMQQALVKCALGPQPAQAALKVLYKLRDDQNVYEIDREAAKGRCYGVCNWFNGAVNLHVHESNHNVAVWLIKRQPVCDTQYPNGLPNPDRHFHTRILHPYDVTLKKEIRVQKAELNGKQQAGFENFMTSKQLDEYCVNGKYYMA